MSPAQVVGVVVGLLTLGLGAFVLGYRIGSQDGFERGREAEQKIWRREASR